MSSYRWQRRLAVPRGLLLLPCLSSVSSARMPRAARWCGRPAHRDVVVWLSLCGTHTFSLRCSLSGALSQVPSLFGTLSDWLSLSLSGISFSSLSVLLFLRPQIFSSLSLMFSAGGLFIMVHRCVAFSRYLIHLISAGCSLGWGVRFFCWSLGRTSLQPSSS